ncbi:MAG: hypothetical protein ACK5P7_10485 [Bdellovibrio sp.]
MASKGSQLWIRLFAFIGLGLTGYQAGLGSLPLLGQIESASSQAQVDGLISSAVTLNDFAQLPCPSEETYQAMAAEVNLVIPSGPSVDQLCDQSPRAALSKTLLLMTRLKIQLPESWPEPLRTDLQDPFSFLKANTTKLTLDLQQKESIAYNKVAVREIYLGGRFFTTEPLGAIAILVHEARHSVREAPGHVFCESGDIPRTAGACDDVFSLENSKSGAYGYGTLFALGLALYSPELSKGDREYMMIDALVQLGARFNKIPDALARKVDVLAVLSTDKKIHLVHPFLGYTKPLNLQFGSSSEVPERIEFAPLHNGLLIYTNLGHVWHWNSLKGLLRLYESVLKPEIPVADVQRLRIPFLEQTAYAVRLKNDSLKVIEYSPSENARVLTNYPQHLGRPIGQVPKIHRMSLGLYNDSIFLGQDGQLYLAPHYGHEDSFGRPQALQSSQGWVSSHGGVLYDSLFLIDRIGDLYRGSLEIVDVSTESDSMTERVYTLAKSELQTTGPLKKFSQGLRIQGALDTTGQVLVWKYGLLEPKPLDLKMKIQDFVLMQNTETREPVGQTTKESENFKRNCRIKRSLPDPWMGRGIGIDVDDHLIIAGEKEGECIRMNESDLKIRTPYFN